MQLDIERYRGLILAAALVVLGILSQQPDTEKSHELAVSASSVFSQVGVDNSPQTAEQIGGNIQVAEEASEKASGPAASGDDKASMKPDDYTALNFLGYFLIGALVCGICLRLGKY